MSNIVRFEVILSFDETIELTAEERVALRDRVVSALERRDGFWVTRDSEKYFAVEKTLPAGNNVVQR